MIGESFGYHWGISRLPSARLLWFGHRDSSDGLRTYGIHLMRWQLFWFRCPHKGQLW